MENSVYISHIEVSDLFGETRIGWDLTPSVNILAGANGSGKSTILSALSKMFRSGRIDNPSLCARIGEIEISFDDDTVVSSSTQFDASKYNVDVISTFDAALTSAEALDKITEGDVKTALDWELYRIQRRYLTYQLSLGKRAIAMLLEHSPEEEFAKLTAGKNLYYDIIDEMFAGTCKKIDRRADELSFIIGNRHLSAYDLSSGEKQLLIILTTVLVQDSEPYILIMDEPEISLHFDWQKVLVSNICNLNPKLQVIMSTHSPAVVMDGWVQNVSEIGDLIIK